MPSLVNNFNTVSGNASNLSSNVKSLGSSWNKMKNPKNFGSASMEFANSAINLAGTVGDLQNSINGLFYIDRDVIKQNMNIMRGNHYISGYQRLPIPPFGPIINPFSPPTILDPFLPPDVKDVLGMSQDIRTQPLVEYDLENFKYSLDRPDETDSFYEDPLFQSFDLIFDRMSSPLFNGEITKFFDTYGTNEYLYKAWINYNKFVQLFFKIFNGYGSPKYEIKDLTKDGKDPSIAFWNWSGQDPKRNKVWYINSVAGLDKLSAKMPNYETDKITITLTEDIAMLVNYMIDSYNNFVYNYAQQRYNLPDNLMRFKMMIRFSDMRTMKLVNHFESPEHMYDKAAEVYTLYDCNFDFFNSKNFTDEIVNGGFGVAKQDTPSTVKFDIIYKSIQKEFRTPLIKNEKNNIIDNKNINSSRELTDILRGKLVRTVEQESSFKELLSAAFGGATSLNNMLGNYIPKYQPPIPNIPNDILGSVYNNLDNDNSFAGRFIIDIPSNNDPNELQLADLQQNDPMISRKKLIEQFATEIKNDKLQILNTTSRTSTTISGYVKNLGTDYTQNPPDFNQDPMGNVYTNDGTPTHDDLGFISLFLKPPQSNNLGNTYENIGFVFNENLGFDYTNDGTPTHGDLGFDYVNDGTPTHGDLGYDYTNDGTPIHGDLGVEYLNEGNRVELSRIVLFGKGTTSVPILGSVYTNLSELKNVNLKTLYDNTVQRQQISLGDLYSNFANKNSVDMGTDYNNNVSKEIVTDIPNVYTNQTINREVNLNDLYGKVEKPITPPLSDVYINTNIDRQSLKETTLFGKVEKSISQMGSVYTNNQNEKSSNDIGKVFDNTVESKLNPNLNNVYTNQLNLNSPNDLGSLFVGTEKLPTQNLGTDYINDGTKPSVILDSVYDNTTQHKNISLESLYINDVIKSDKTNLNSLYNNETNKTGKLEGETLYSNTVDKSKFDLGSDFNNKDVQRQSLNGETISEIIPIEKLKEDLGDSYENNLIEE